MKRGFESGVGSKFEQTGNIFEWQNVNQINVESPEYKRALKEAELENEKTLARETNVREGYVNFEKSLELAKKFQPYDPTHPDKPFARDIRIELSDLLGLKTEEEMDSVKFFTAVGSPLDKFHGIDAFIEYEDKNKNIARATFDLTTNPNKKSYRADIVIQARDLPDPHLDGKKYLAAIEAYAKQILPKMVARKLQEEKGVIFGKQ